MGLIHHATKREPPCPLPVSGRDASANNTLVLTHRNTSPSPPSHPSCPKRPAPQRLSSNLVFVGWYVCKLGNTGCDEVVIQSPTPGECPLGASPCAPRSYSACLDGSPACRIVRSGAIIATLGAVLGNIIARALHINGLALECVHVAYYTSPYNAYSVVAALKQLHQRRH